MTRYLVTGAAGFIGSNFVDHLLCRGDTVRVVGLDMLSHAGRVENLVAAGRDRRFRLVTADINQEQAVYDVLVGEGIGTIVHFAAHSHVDRSITQPAPFITSNIFGTYRLIEAARRAWSAGGKWRDGCRFHHVSTDEVYGSLGPDDPTFCETTSYAPRSPYSASKAASDHLVRAWHHTYGLPVTISVCCNNYGPRQFPEKLVPLMILNCLHGRPLPIFGLGLNVRDWLHVTDHCAAIEVVLQRGRPGETYNIGTNNEWQNLGLVRELCSHVDALFAARGELAARFPRCPAGRGKRCASLITFVADRPGHDLRYAVDATRIANLGFTAQRSFAQGLRDTVAWYVDNQAWWQPLMDAGPPAQLRSSRPSR